MDKKTRIIIFVVAIVLSILFLLPTAFRDSFPKSWISKPISLGLDLSGGVHLVYEVKTKEAVKGRLQSIGNGIRSSLRKEKIAVTRVEVNDAGELAIALLTDRMAERAKALVAEEYRQDLQFVRQGNEGGRTQLVYSVNDAWISAVEQSSVNQAVETLRQRVDQFGVAEPLIQRNGQNRILLQMPGVTDIESVKKIVGSVAKLEFRFLPTGATSAYQVTMKDRDGGTVAVEDEVQMSGDVVDTAHWGRDQQGRVEVSLSLTSDGAHTFARLTRENVNRQLAIILDNVVYSSPVINEPITGGRASISGSFTQQEANELSIILRSGALPAPLEVMEERTVGPSLGRESIENGIKAIALGFILIIGFMVVYYRKSGMVAVFTLGLNLLFMMALLSAFGATLTLPGLAGLALTIGMAVDANVIIYERIRDEMRRGAGRDKAVSSGFEQALSAIIDSNVTTLLAAVILYYFGTGSIRGFAVTLAVGILATIFCATFVSRLIFDCLELRNRKQELSI